MCPFYCYAIPCVLFSFVISLMGKRELGCLTLIVVLVSFDCYCHVALPHDSVGVQCVVVVFRNHTHLLFFRSPL